MQETYTIEEVMEMHTYTMNKVMKAIDEKKRFIHLPEEKIIICEHKNFIGSWKEVTRETYKEVMFNDFGR